MKERYFDKESCCRIFKIIFMDIEMPIKNGFAAAEEIRTFFTALGDEKEEATKYFLHPLIIACSA